MPTYSYEDFIDAIGQRESSNNYTAVNRFNYLGRYQMGEAALVDAGYVKKDNNVSNNDYKQWVGKDGVNSASDFLNNPTAQDNAIKDYYKEVWKWAKKLNLEQYVGQEVGGVVITHSGLIAGAHLVGIGALDDFLKSDGASVPKDANKVKVTEYLDKFKDYETPFEPASIDPDSCPVPDLPIWLAPYLDTIAGVWSPLIIDMDNDGLELTNLNTDAVYWDIDNDGFKEASAWVKPDDALLVMDWNNNGRIDNHSELFGTNIVDGFTKLTELDSNSDNVIDSNDDAFADLQIWQDANQDGISQAAELQTLTGAGIASISLSDSPFYTQVAGNDVTHISSVTFSDASTRNIYDAWFKYDNQNTYFSGDITLDVRTLLLPTLRGYSEIKDLFMQMSLDQDLLEKVDNLSQMSLADVIDPTKNFDDRFKEILYGWGGTDVSNWQNASVSFAADSRKVSFVQDIAGKEIHPDGALGTFQGGVFRDVGLWENTVTHYAAHFLVQTVFKELFSGDAVYDLQTGVVTGATGLSSAAIGNVETLINGTADPAYGWSLVVRTVEEVLGVSNLSSTDYNLLDDAIQNSVVGLDLDRVLDLVKGVPNDVIGTSSDDTLTGTFVDDMMDGQYGNDILDGGRGDDQLSGNQGNDTYIGGSGDDIMSEGNGSGNEIYIYDSGNDIIAGDIYGSDKIQFRSGITSADLSMSLKNAIDPNSALVWGQADLVINVEGLGSITLWSQYGPYINGGVIETIEFANLATINLFTMNNFVYGTSGNDTVIGVDRSYYLNDRIDTGGGDDIINGGLGQNYLSGGWGNDTYVYGGGIDTILDSDGSDDKIVFDNSYDPDLFEFKLNPLMSQYDNSSMWLKIFYDGELKTVIEQQFGSTSSFVEKVVIDGVHTFNLASMNWTQYGTDASENLFGIVTNAIPYNIIYGMGGNDSITGQYNHAATFYGGDGNDSMVGENLIDHLYGGDGNDYLNGNGGSDILEGGSGNDNLWGGDYYDANGNDTLIGGAGDDILDGNRGNDTLNGGSGSDTVYGGDGDDTAVYDLGENAGAVDVYTGNAGNDTFELHLRASDLTEAVGGDIVGYAGFLGNAGNLDTTQSTGATYQFASFGLAASRFENFKLFIDGTERSLLTLNGVIGTAASETLSGGAGIDVILANAGNDTLFGYGGDDYLIGGTGGDALYGGLGNDTYVVDDTGDSVVENANEGTDLVQSFVTHTLGANVENLLLVGNAAINGTGNALDNYLYGNAGNNILNGDAGIDIMAGGRGDDSYGVDNLNDLVLEESNGGTDTVYAFINHAIGENIENLTLLTGDNLNATGNGLNNIVTGNAGNNWLTGGGGDDTLNGGMGNDTLQGDAGNDLMDGGAGNDILGGLQGADSLTGGSGSDMFYFNDTALSGIDRIMDFKVSEGDTLNIADLLVGYTPGTSNINDFVSLTASGGNMSLAIDRDGTGSTYNDQTVATLNSVSSLIVNDLLTNGNLIV